ncbi:MAG: DUF4351 domain-containing protein [Candidatus Sericytochromatia bacterium]|nr:DUF4351 domain-containing protein [Candidatus Sericytochromatia bacterium]
MPPSAIHEILIELLRQAPEHVAEAVWRLRGRAAPDVPLHIAPSEATEPLPVERRADLVVLLGDAKKPTSLVVVEVQLKRDEDKHYKWPDYVVALRTRWRCPADLLVVAPNPRVAVWAARPIAIDTGTSSLAPLVLGPATLPRAAPETLAGRPHAAVLQALMHCRGPGDIPLFRQAMHILEPLPVREKIGYHENMREALAPSFLALAEVAMSFEQTTWYQNLVAKLQAEGEARGRAEGAEEGRKRELIRVISRLLGRRVGLPGPEALARMEGMAIETLEDLAEALLDFNGPEDLEGWLSAHG